MVVRAAQAGCHVLCAKPATTTIQSVDRMIAAGREHGRHILIDFQHVYAPATQAIKEAISQGKLGTVQSVISKTLWQRNDEYFARNPGGGKFLLNGHYVLDGPINNPHAHYIFNALYFASHGRHDFARPETIQAELYHAFEIECEDTASIRCQTDTGVTVCCYSTVCRRDSAPITEIEVIGDKGRALWHWTDYEIDTVDGEDIRVSSQRGAAAQVFATFLDVLEGKGEALVTVEDAKSHVLFTNGAYESAREIHRLRPPHAQAEVQSGKHVRYIDGIDDIVAQAAAEQKLFSELGLPWARASEPFDMKGYCEFSLFRD